MSILTNYFDISPLRVKKKYQNICKWWGLAHVSPKRYSCAIAIWNWCGLITATFLSFEIVYTCHSSSVAIIDLGVKVVWSGIVDGLDKQIACVWFGDGLDP